MTDQPYINIVLTKSGQLETTYVVSNRVDAQKLMQQDVLDQDVAIAGFLHVPTGEFVDQVKSSD